MFQLAFVFVLFATDCKEAYLEKILNSENSDYYVIFKYDVAGSKAEAFAPNYKIYEVLKATKHITDLPDYVRFMKDKIKRNESISLSFQDLRKMEASRVGDDAEVIALAAKSPDSVLNRYFYVSREANYARLRYDYPMNKFGSIMKVLFQKNFLIRRIEGQFNIEELNFCSLASK